MSETPVAKSDDVDPSEVSDFLNNQTPDLTRGVDLKLPVDPAPAPEVQPPAVVIPPDSTFDPKAPTQQQAAESLVDKEVEFSLSDISPTEREKSEFLTAMLNDETFVLQFSLPGLKDVPVVVNTRNNAQQALVFEILALDQKEQRVTNTMTYLSWLQYYDASLRLVSFGSRKYGPVKLDGESLAKDAARLRAYATDHFLPMPVAKWKLVAAAIRFFDLKLAAMTNSLIARDFSQPAG